MSKAATPRQMTARLQPPRAGPYAELAELIRRARLAAGLTQGRLARQIRVSWRTVHIWERGKRLPRRAYARLLSRALGAPEISRQAKRLRAEMKAARRKAHNRPRDGREA